MAEDRDAMISEWSRLIDAQSRAQRGIDAGTAAAVTVAWRAVPDPYDPAAGTRFTKSAAAAVRQGRTRRADLIAVTLRKFLQLFGVQPPRVSPKPIPQPRGIPIEEEFERALKEWRFRASEGVPFEQARDRGLERALLIADMDLSMAGRDASRDVLDLAPQIVGFRRVLRPELSKSGEVCGLCIAAADHHYKRGDLLPLHDRCNCTTAPIFEGQEDWAQTINGIDIESLYKDLGETKAKKLKRIRVKVVTHGELGPVLVNADHNFRGPGDLPSAA